MHSSRLWLLMSTLVMVLTGTSVAQPVAATIDATRRGQPITKLMFGGFMEPATTQVWAEMLSDRKFFNEINSKPAAAPAGGLGRRGPQRRWMPVGADEFVVMDSKNSYVGEWSPRIRLEAATPHGISQSGIALRAGRAYVGRVVLAGSPGAKVEVTLAWGPDPADRQTVSIPALTTNYARFPLKFTAKTDTNEGRFEIVGTGNGAIHIGAASLIRLLLFRVLGDRDVAPLPWTVHFVANSPDLYAVRRGMSVSHPQLTQPAGGGTVHVLDFLGSRVGIAKTRVYCNIGLRTDQAAEGHEVVDPHVVRLHPVPRKFSPRRPLIGIAYAVTPVIGGHEVPAGPARNRNSLLPQKTDRRGPETRDIVPGHQVSGHRHGCGRPGRVAD